MKFNTHVKQGRTIKHGRSRSLIFTLVIIAVIGCLSVSAGWAQTASSGGFGLQADIELSVLGLGGEGLHTGSQPSVFGQGTASYGPIQDVVYQLDENLLGAVGIGIDVLSAAAAYDAGSMLVSGEGATEGTDVSVGVPGIPALQVSADVLLSESVISGECGDLSATAGGTIVNGQISVAGQVIELPVNAPPNTVIALPGIAGVSVILNEQVITGSGDEDLAVISNALRISFDIDLLLAELAGELIFGNSHASLSGCVVAGDQQADLAVFKSAPASVFVNQPLAYTISVENTGPDTAVNVVMTDPLPLGLGADSVTATGGFSCADNFGVITCTIASLAPGANGLVTINTTPTNAGVVLNTAFVESDTMDPDLSNNDSTAGTEIDDTGGGSGTG